jgi:hypothetical protein
MILKAAGKDEKINMKMEEIWQTGSCKRDLLR